MPIRLKLDETTKTVLIHASGKLVKADYEQFVPELETLFSQHGQLRTLFDITGLKGWDAGALWEEIKFDVRHFSDFDRIAVIGDEKWEAVMTWLCKPFSYAEIRYFDEGRLEDAQRWLNRPTQTRSIHGVSKQEVALVAITRVALGIGIGLLLSKRLCNKSRDAAGLALVALGVATTVPLAIDVFGRGGCDPARSLENRC